MRSNQTIVVLALAAIAVAALVATNMGAPRQSAAQASNEELVELLRQALDGCRIEGQVIDRPLLRDRDEIQARIRCLGPEPEAVRLPTR